MSYVKAGGRSAVRMPRKARRRRAVVPRPVKASPESSFPRISREAVEELLAKARERA